MFTHIIDNYYHVETDADIISAINDKCGNDVSSIVPTKTEGQLPGFIRVSTTQDQIAGFVSRFAFVVPEQISDKVNIWLERSVQAQAKLSMLSRRSKTVVDEAAQALHFGNMSHTPDILPEIGTFHEGYALPTNISPENLLLAFNSVIDSAKLLEKAHAEASDFSVAGGVRKIIDEMKQARQELDADIKKTVK